MLKCKKGSQVTQPCSLAVAMPCPPRIDNGEVQRSYPRLRTELRHLEIMVSAALMQTQGVGYKVWFFLPYQLLWIRKFALVLSPVHKCTVTSCGEIAMVRYSAWHVLCVGDFFFASHPLANCSLLPNSFQSILLSVIQTIQLLDFQCFNPRSRRMLWKKFVAKHKVAYPLDTESISSHLVVHPKVCQVVTVCLQFWKAFQMSFLNENSVTTIL